MGPIDTANTFTWFKTRFNSRTMVLINVTTSDVAVGATALTVAVEEEDGYK
jgi:hypothetical protein